MHLRRFLAPAMWLVATIVAAALVSGAVRLAVRGVSSPAAASRPQSVHTKGDASAGSRTGDTAHAATTAAPGARLPVVDGSETTGTVGGSTSSTVIARATTPTGLAAATPQSSVPGADGTSATTTPNSPSTSSVVPPSSTTTSTTTPSATSSTTTSSTTSSTTTSTTAQPVVSQGSTGGTVGVQCNGDSVSLAYATPNNGYSTKVQSSANPVDVYFIGSNHHASEIYATCSGGQPTFRVSERTRD